MLPYVVTSQHKLNFRPSQARLEDTKQISLLEKRLQTLELIVGSKDDSKATLTEIGAKSLLEAQTIISTRMSLLDQASVDQIDARLSSVLQQIKSISEQKKTIEDPGKHQKLIELYELMQKSQRLYKNVPLVQERLFSLKEVHDRASTFANSLTEIESLQKQVASNLSQNKESLASAEKQFEQNILDIKANLQRLEAKKPK